MVTRPNTTCCSTPSRSTSRSSSVTPRRGARSRPTSPSCGSGAAARCGSGRRGAPRARSPTRSRLRRPGPALQRLVRVLKHDLTSEPPPAPPYDLIVCRNVVIYFDRPMQERLFLAFAEALAPGGILLLGKVETLFGAVRERLALEEPRERIYRRPL